jgi:membrane-associated phospholipid phosphatase
MGADEKHAPHRRHWYFWTGPRAVFRTPAFTVFPSHFLHRTSGASAVARSFPSDVVSDMVCLGIGCCLLEARQTQTESEASDAVRRE